MHRTITIRDAATTLGISPRRVRAIAARLGVGEHVTPRMLMLSASEVKQIGRARGKVGNPNWLTRPGRR